MTIDAIYAAVPATSKRSRGITTDALSRRTGLSKERVRSYLRTLEAERKVVRTGSRNPGQEWRRT